MGRSVTSTAHQRDIMTISVALAEQLAALVRAPAIATRHAALYLPTLAFMSLMPLGESTPRSRLLHLSEDIEFRRAVRIGEELTSTWTIRPTLRTPRGSVVTGTLDLADAGGALVARTRRRVLIQDS